MTSYKKRGFTKRKRFHKIFLQVQEMEEVLHTCSLPFNKFIGKKKNHSRPFINLKKNQENTFVTYFHIVIKVKE